MYVNVYQVVILVSFLAKFLAKSCRIAVYGNHSSLLHIGV